MKRAIVTLNAGSSSLKFALFSLPGDGAPTALATGLADGIGTSPRLKIRDGDGRITVDRALESGLDHAGVLKILLAWITENTAHLALIAAGHRVVHGGTQFSAPVRVDGDVLARLQALVPLAPLHQPHNLAAIRALGEMRPDLVQVACFDTAFHATNAPAITSYALPRALTAQGVRRYGFHGLSYEYIASVLPDYLGPRAEGRVVVAHLGNGASMCAMQGRKSVTSTMGMTALDGLPMGTRSGAIDPGVLLYLMREKGMGYQALSDLLYNESGLLGVSGISSDVRVLLASPAPEAAEAVEMFCYRIARELGALAAALGGLDALVFTAGIGEHAAPVRARACALSAWLGIALEAGANRANGPRISAPQSAVPVYVIPTNEDLMIARHTATILAPEGA